MSLASIERLFNDGSRKGGHPTGTRPGAPQIYSMFHRTGCGLIWNNPRLVQILPK